MRISDWSSDVCSSDLLAWPAKELNQARATLEAHGDHVNASHARYLDSRRHLLIGRLDDAERIIAGLVQEQMPHALGRSEELREGQACLRQCRLRWTSGY